METKLEKKRGKLGVADSTLLRKAVLDAVVSRVAAIYEISPRCILGRGRTERVAEARMMTMYILLQRGATSTGVGRVLDRDHGTALHARKRIRDLLTWSRRTQRAWNELRPLADEESVLEPVAHYRVQLAAEVEFSADMLLGREELERRATRQLITGNGRPKMVCHTVEAL